MTTVYLVRHAHADWRDDEQRSLSASGYEAAQRVAGLLSTHPISAIYSSPYRRAIETVEPLAGRLGLDLKLVADLRERKLPPVATGNVQQLVARAWSAPDIAVEDGESNVTAQARGLAAIRHIVGHHDGEHVAVATHGNLLTLILNSFDPAYGYEFWKALSLPDVYRLEFEGTALLGVERLWDGAVLT